MRREAQAIDTPREPVLDASIILVKKAGLSNDQEARLDAVARNTVPHDTGLARGQNVPEFHYLTRVQGGVVVAGAKSAFTVIEQPSGNFQTRRIIKGEIQLSIGGMNTLFVAILQF